MSQNNTNNKYLNKSNGLKESTQERKDYLYKMYVEQTKQDPLYRRNNQEFETKAFKQWYKSIKGDKEEPTLKERIDNIVEQIHKTYDILTLIDTRQTLVRKYLAYIGDPTDIYRLMKEYIDDLHSGSYTSIRNNIIEGIKDNILIKREELCYNPHFMIFQNAVIDFEFNEIYSVFKYDHDKEEFTNERTEDLLDYRFFFEIGYDLPLEPYIGEKYPNPTRYKLIKNYCPKFKYALRSWLDQPAIIKERENEKGEFIKYIDKKRVKNRIRPGDIFEMWGYSMTCSTAFKKAFITYGEKDSGKTQYLNIFEDLFNKFNKSNTALQRLSKNEFGLDNLPLKIVNIRDDLPETKIFSLGIFKDLTGGGGSIQGEIKGGAKFSFKNTAKFHFACNQIPIIENIKDIAGIERFILTNFPNKFTNKSPNFKEDFFNSILRDPNEMKGIIYESIKGYKRLLKRKGFREEILENTRHIWIYESDPVYRFLHDHCIKDITEKVKWNDFKDKFNDIMLESYSSQKLRTSIERFGLKKAKRSFTAEETKKIDCVIGVMFKEELEMLEEIEEIPKEKIWFK